MAVKCTGAEYKRFIESDWGGDAYMDDYVISINGTIYNQFDGGLDEAEEKIQPSDKMVIIEGDVFVGSGWVRSLEAHFKQWRKKQTTAFLAVECPIDKLDAVKAAIIAAGGKVV